MNLPLQISPSILNSFQDLHNDDCPWMTAEKFKAQLLSSEPMSEPADAGNAVHEAAFDHDLVDFPAQTALEITNSDGNVWWVDPALVLAIRKHTKGFGTGIPEVGRLLTAEELGIPGVRVSMRADYLTLPATTELKTSARIKALKYVQSAQRLAYLVAYKVPVTFVLAQVKITKPRTRPATVRGSIALDHCISVTVAPSPDDIDNLRDLIDRCLHHIRKDDAMRIHLERKPPPSLL